MRQGQEPLVDLYNINENYLPKDGKVITGVVKWFGEHEGKKRDYGFLLDSENREYFVHYSEIKASGFKNLARGQHVKFIGKEGPKGLFAESVEVINVGE